MEKITKKMLLEQGFIEFNPSYIDYARKCYEKKYVTEYGTYFLDIKEYADMYRDHKLLFPERYEIYARLFKYGTHEPLEIVFEFEDIDSVNEYILEMFKCKLIESCNREELD